jgi:hypothetical protein
MLRPASPFAHKTQKATFADGGSNGQYLGSRDAGYRFVGKQIGTRSYG